MKRRFASFLLSGKAATLPLAPTSALAVSDDIFGSNLHIMERADNGTVELISEFGDAPGTSGYGGTTAANVVFPDSSCSTGTQPDTVNLVISGISPGEDVFIIASTQKDDPFLSQAFPGARFGSDGNVIKVFNYQSAGAPNSTGIVSIPVRISELGIAAPGDTIYLQAAAATRNASGDTFTQFRFSELDEVTATSDNCSYGDSSYGSGSTY